MLKEDKKSSKRINSTKKKNIFRDKKRILIQYKNSNVNIFPDFAHLRIVVIKQEKIFNLDTLPCCLTKATIRNESTEIC